MKIVIMGSSGMLGSSLTRHLSSNPAFAIHTVDRSHVRFFENAISHQVDDLFDKARLDEFLKKEKPDLVINCIGIVKQKESTDFDLVKVNSLLPYILADFASKYDFNIIHFSTDCVFSGLTGNYSDSDVHDALDLYGRSKSLGEVLHNKVLNLRTSIIGHGVEPNSSLIDWFISKKGTFVSGFTKAIFSGFPTIVISEIIEDILLTKDFVAGTFNLSASPISKFELLEKVSAVYALDIQISPDRDFCIDRSLCSRGFKEAYGFHPKSWDEMITMMYNEYLSYHKNEDVL